ncbi:MAG: AraC family transcriptional regulator [Nocardioidaceae bacterium]
MDHLQERLDLAQLARNAGVSSRTFARRFRAETGAGPLQYPPHRPATALTRRDIVPSAFPMWSPRRWTATSCSTSPSRRNMHGRDAKGCSHAGTVNI